MYCWDGTDIVAEQVDGGKIKTYLRGINLIAREIDRMVYYYIFNEHGDVTQLWSQSGTCKASYEYDAFGVEKTLDKEENPFRYCGEYFSIEDGTYYLRNRNYDLRTGRFTQEDPVGAGLNYYTYCGNNPISFVDPYGLERIVVSGGSDGMEEMRYSFIETAIKCIIDWQPTRTKQLCGLLQNGAIRGMI